MSEENRIRFAGLMEAYLNIPSFVCELIEKQLQDNKYKEVIEYIVQRRNEIENKKDYLSEQEKIKRYLDLQQKVEQLEKENKELKEENKRIFQNVNDDELLISNAMNYSELKKAEKKIEQLENIRKEAIEELSYMSTDAYVEDYDIREKHYNLLMNILNKGDNK